MTISTLNNVKLVHSRQNSKFKNMEANREIVRVTIDFASQDGQCGLFSPVYRLLVDPDAATDEIKSRMVAVDGKLLVKSNFTNPFQKPAGQLRFRLPEVYISPEKRQTVCIEFDYKDTSRSVKRRAESGQSLDFAPRSSEKNSTIFVPESAKWMIVTTHFSFASAAVSERFLLPTTLSSSSSSIVSLKGSRFWKSAQFSTSASFDKNSPPFIYLNKITTAATDTSDDLQNSKVCLILGDSVVHSRTSYMPGPGFEFHSLSSPVGLEWIRSLVLAPALKQGD